MDFPLIDIGIPMANSNIFIALGSRLQGISEVVTLGVKPNFQDYTSQEKKMILDSPRILFPTLNYAQFLTTMGKQIFPSLETYLYADEKIKQTTLFQYTCYFCSNALGVEYML